MESNQKRFETTFAGRTLIVETGKTSALANGSCWVRYGDTVVMANVTASEKPREGIDFFPLSVDYEEKLYAVGKIPGSFLKREARPSENAVLTSRMVDRPMRPLFPADMRNDVTVVMTVLATDIDNSPEITASIAASIAVSISDIPFNGPIATVNVGLVDGTIVLNPMIAEREQSTLALTVAGNRDKIVMIEAGASEVDEETMLQAIEAGHQEIRQMVDFIAGIQQAIGKEKFTFPSQTLSAEMFDDVAAIALTETQHALDTDNKLVRDERLVPIYDKVYATLGEKYPDRKDQLSQCMYQLQKKIVRNWLLEGKRVDGRGMDEMRPLAAEVNLLPRVHGSGLFTRGQTQVLSVATLGAVRDVQRLDSIDENDTKRYMHNYNFPSYSVGETRPSRGPGRREIGHGALAERALLPVLPSLEEFPYAIRVVSEVLSSNGSTSQGAICGSTLALMDAGVPIKAPVAGISCGLIEKPDGSFTTMVDIQGLEDFYGDMDFKVGGTHQGITAIQVDIKINGLTMEIIREALEKTKRARLHILDEVMKRAIPAPRATVNEYAPKVLQTKVPVDKIKDVIGKGGSVIQKICADYQVKIDLAEDGVCVILGVDLDEATRALAVVESITQDPEVGAIYQGVVTRLMPFGVFVEFAPGKEGLVHISKLAHRRVEKVEDVVSVGDSIAVKVLEIDDKGRINLSKKDAL